MKSILLIFVVLLLTGCETVVKCQTASPGMFPLTAPGTGDELFENCPPSKCPILWEYISRLAVYKEQLSVVPENKIKVSIVPPEVTP